MLTDVPEADAMQEEQQGADGDRTDDGAALVARFVVDLARSPLQYLRECSVWTTDRRSRDAVERLAHQQAEDVTLLAEWLLERQLPVELGQYPLEYADWHFVAIDFLRPLLVRSQQGLMADLAAAIETLSARTPARSVLQSVHDREAILLAELEQDVLHRTGAGRLPSGA